MSTETSEATLLDAVVARYKAEGFDVFVHPSPSILPPFLRGYRPDAIAMRPDKRIAMEFVRPGSPSADKINQLRELFSPHKDWEFVVFYSSPGTSTAGIEVSSRDAIERAIQQTVDLQKAGQQVAALVMGWSALEAIARALLPERLARPQPPASLVDALASEGYLTPSEADMLRTAASVRNDAAHGKLTATVEPTQLDTLASALHTLRGFLPKDAA